MNKRYFLQVYLSNFPSFSFSTKNYPDFEFHVLASVRKKYEIDNSLFNTSGNLIFPNYHSVRLLSQKMNVGRDLLNHPDQTIKTGQLNAMGLIDEIYHYVLRLYEETSNPKVFQRALIKLDKALDHENTNRILYQFVTLFPPLKVYLENDTIDNYLQSTTGDKSHKEILLEEMILLYFSNFNPAAINLRELFNDKDLKERTFYSKSIIELEKFFQTEKNFGPQNQFIFDLLRAPILASPNSLGGQLEYIKNNWGLILSDKFLKRILSAGDLIKEDFKLIFHTGPHTPPVPRYNIDELKGIGLMDFERFTSDLDWMPNVVLLAKNVYVWLNQLSKKHQRSITNLNEIPDEELDLLVQWNITALWLIGIWERSSASQKIKQWTGNPEAVSSAYSLYDYTIANDLGGEVAFQNLRYRAWQRGIRLAGDMVPNHMGIFSKWIVERPDYFIQSEYSPFPNYKFTGGNLSDNPDIELRIEDGYWSRTDAAVVFQRIDKRNGNIRYIYHGNDGTHMPWNDTAQLDFLKSEIREAVIQTIFHVARKFSIIRFDAAMTLTKRHFQRLWYPQPGSGGDIPSRADYTFTTDEFNKFFPNEFWREVVDRINQEMPNTLLLAEAFWLLEGYFVRTLGMHRVYNSAFMHMLMKEENSKYRELIRNTMHYNPEILKRYVNFMSNPDEQTAIAQFGKDDKYFGAALLMVTLPGLPMFAHGQIEGFTEKYGMEYKRAYYNEEPDTNLIRRHEEEIFPLLGKRHLFSQVTNFELFDLINTDGDVNENVFVFSNKSGNERALICFHNKYEEVSGRIKMSVGRNTGTTDNPHIVYKTIAEALELSIDPNTFYLFKDRKTNFNYIRSGKDMHERGLQIHLKAFQYHIFVDFKEIYDNTGEYARLAAHLHGKGTPDIQEELWTVKLSPVLFKMFDLINDSTCKIFLDHFLSTQKRPSYDEKFTNNLVSRFDQFVKRVKIVTNSNWEIDEANQTFKKRLLTIRQLSSDDWRFDSDKISAIDFTREPNLHLLYTWLILSSIHELDYIEYFSYLRLRKALSEIFESLSLESEMINKTVLLLKLLLTDDCFLSGKTEKVTVFLDQDEAKNYLLINEYNGAKYFNKGRMEELINWISIISIISERKATTRKIKILMKSLDKSGYRVEDFINKISTLEGKSDA